MFEYFIKKLNEDNRGFTLIELVIVIAIIGILAAIAVTKMSSTTKKAAVSAHNANVRTLESAASMYIADEGVPSTQVTWESEGGTKANTIKANTITESNTNANNAWAKYLQEWPTVPKGIKDKSGKNDLGGKNYTVTIKEDGTITVKPGKADKDGKVTVDPD